MPPLVARPPEFDMDFMQFGFDPAQPFVSDSFLRSPHFLIITYLTGVRCFRVQLW